LRIGLSLWLFHFKVEANAIYSQRMLEDCRYGRILYRKDKLIRAVLCLKNSTRLGEKFVWDYGNRVFFADVNEKYFSPRDFSLLPIL
jgi:hypothetical protein